MVQNNNSCLKIIVCLHTAAYFLVFRIWETFSTDVLDPYMVGWLVGFKAYEPFSGYLMPNQVILIKKIVLVLFGGISAIVDYLMPNPFLYIWTVLFQTI